MATKIILKKSSTAGAVPLTTDLEIGEVALNLADRKLYTKNNSSVVVPIGSAYVSTTAPSAPAEGDMWYDSANDLLKTYNGTTWASAGYSTLAALEDTTITAVAAGEVLKYDGTKWINNTLAEANISEVGHTHTSGAITDFTEAVQDVVGAAVVGGTGITVAYNDTTGLTTVTNSAVYTHPTQTAIAVDATNNGTNVIDSVTVNTLGHVTAVTTRDLSAATTSAAGVMSAADKTKLDGIASGAEVNQNAFSTVAVSGQNNVVADAKTDTLTLAAGTGVSITTTDTTDTITFTNTAPDQTVVLTAGAAITVTGTYPNFTVAHTDTSTQASVDNSGATVIQDVTLDTNGHVTGLASVAITPALIGAATTSHTHTIADITSITIDGTPADNEVLAYDTTSSKWINQTAAEAGLAAATHNHTLDSLSNVTITSNANGEILRWNGSAWINNTLAEAGIAAVGHTHTAANITDFNEAAQDAVGTIMSGTGIATVTYNDVANTIVVNAVEADTLATVTSRGNTTTNGISVATVTTTGDVTVGGNLTVNGTVTTVNSNTVNIGDNIIVLNADETGAPSQNAGFEVERGTADNVQFIWNETNDAWDMGDWTLQNVKLDGGSY
jgi:hypothetical protein